jgi:hypothetical protein
MSWRQVRSGLCSDQINRQIEVADGTGKGFTAGVAKAKRNALMADGFLRMQKTILNVSQSRMDVAEV